MVILLKSDKYYENKEYNDQFVDIMNGGGGGSSVQWGSIGGNISNQSDLSLLLNEKASKNYVNTQLDNKADLSYVNTQLDNKANKSDIASAYQFKGAVNNYTDLPTSGLDRGDTYYIFNADPTHGIPAGSNVIWNGTNWVLVGQGLADLSNYYTKSDTNALLVAKANISHNHNIGDVNGLDTALNNKYDKSYIDTELSKKIDATNTYTKSEIDLKLLSKTDKTYVDTVVDTKQNKLVAGTNITIDPTTNTISATNGGQTYTAGNNIEITSDNKINNTLTKVSQLTNDSGYITNSEIAGKADKTYVDTQLSGKANTAITLSGYGITDAYTKDEVDGKISGVFHFKGSVDTKEELPTIGQQVGDVYTVLTESGVCYAWSSDGEWKSIGNTVDLSLYAKTSYVNTQLNTKADKTYVDTQLAKKVDKETNKSLVLDTEITKLSTFIITSATNEQILVYNSTNGKWENKDKDKNIIFRKFGS